jgi:hypothetical protein
VGAEADIHGAVEGGVVILRHRAPVISAQNPSLIHLFKPIAR